MKKKMMILSLISWMMAFNVNAVGHCMINKWFDKTVKSKSIKLEQTGKDTERKDIFLSQLPSVSLAAGKSVNQKKDSHQLINITNYSPEMNLSVNLYSGGRTFLDLDENDLEHKALTMKMMSERNEYVYELLSSVFSLKTMSSNQNDLSEQIRLYERNREVYSYLVNSGKKPRIELDLINASIADLHVQYDMMTNNKKRVLLDAERRFVITENELIQINYSDFNGCIEYKDIELKQKEIETERERTNIHMKKIEKQILPDITLSAGLAPTYEGGHVNYSKPDYQVSVGLSVNLSTIFKQNNDKESEITRLRQSELQFEEAVISYAGKRDEVISELQNTRLQLEVLYKNMETEQRKLDFVKEQMESGKESFLYYMDMLNRMLLLKSGISDMNNRKEYYEVLFSFFN
ncbi:TolC family protein [Salmonella enterica]|nr:TolC family protein [Salmonella enterica]EHF6859853.1 TolC family protein [Salmonella enterica subsp. enterica serovar Panama]